MLANLFAAQKNIAKHQWHPEIGAVFLCINPTLLKFTVLSWAFLDIRNVQ